MDTFWNKSTSPIVALAPMEGYTDSAFRQIAKGFGADIVYTEFLSSDAIGHDAPRVLDSMTHASLEAPVVCQIFGRDITMFKKATKVIERKGFAGIDINFGCPARKVVGNGAGVALLRDPQYARQLIESVLASTSLPVSIKVRTSIHSERKEIAPGSEDRYTALDLVAAINDLPVKAIMVHGRSFEGGFSSDIDVDMIKAVTNNFPGVVLANGGIQKPRDAKKMLEDTGADGVGIARGAVGQPWIFKQIKQLLATGEYDAVSGNEIKDTMLHHAQLAFEAKGAYGLIELRKHLVAYVKGFPGASDLRAQLVHTKTIRDIKKILAAVAL